VNSPTLRLWYSSYDNWDRQNVQPWDITQDTVVSNIYNSFTPYDWNTFELDLGTWSVADDLTDGWLTVGIDNPTNTYSYVYFHGPDAPGMVPYIDVEYEDCSN
jgi:hypothetical protein